MKCIQFKTTNGRKCIIYHSSVFLEFERVQSCLIYGTELGTSCAAPLRCYGPWLGGRQYYVDVFLLTLLEPCMSTDHFTEVDLAVSITVQFT